MSKPAVVRVHNSCRRTYTSKRKYEQFSAQRNDDDAGNPVSCKSLRSQTSLFNWKEHCLLCSAPVIKDERHPNRKDYRCVETLEIKESILNKCLERSDSWGIEVQSRLLACNDLVAEEAVYHVQCHRKFCRTPCYEGTGRPVDRAKDSVFEHLCAWLEEGDSDLLTLAELAEKAASISENDDIYSERYIKKRLQERYGEHIMFAEVKGRKNVICWSKMASYIINTQWYDDRKCNVEEDSERIVIAAAKLIKAAIRETTYSKDAYPSCDEFTDVQQARKWLPHLLISFLDHLVCSDVKKVALGHSIVQATRPKSVLSPLLLGLTVSLDHVFGGKTWLVHLLKSMGFSLSYDELIRFKQSVVQHADVDCLPPYPLCFTQFVADNVDHNICTVDGQNIFHGMGIIAVSAPCLDDVVRSGKYADYSVPRCPRRKVSAIVHNRGIPLLSYNMPMKSGLASLSFNNSEALQHLFSRPASNAEDVLWHVGWFVSSTRPGWAGFMHDINEDHSLPPCATVRMLPIIDRNPNDLTCIFSTLNFISQQAASLQMPTACITFDHPLWLKAIDVIHSHQLNIVCRLGPFHTMMSFLGSIGAVMAGSGLTELLECCYGSNTITQMLAGKAVKRAVRGHILVSALNIAMLRMVMDSALTSDDLKDLNIYEDIVHHRCSLSDLQSSNSLQKVQQSMRELKAVLAEQSRTAKLWLQYCYHVDVLKSFIRAERLGDWMLHLSTIARMLNLFAATGHNNYAKSGRLYLEMMMKLPDEHPWLYTKFMFEGLHSVRRSRRVWAGLASDLTIEQVMMKALKSQGGLTHGRGMSDSVRLTWVKTVHKCATMHSAVAALTNISYGSDEAQHASTFTSQIKRDFSDLLKVLDWLDANNPFNVTDGRLRSVSSGVSASDKDSINCDNAEAIGETIMKKLDGQIYTEVVLKKCDQVKTLSHLSTLVLPSNKGLDIDQSVLFHRLLIILARCDDMASYFGYELTAVPAALFKENFMRKPVKAQLKNELIKDVKTAPLVSLSPAETPVLAHVVDGGFLLHKVKWLQDVTYADILQQYVNFLKKRYSTPGNVTVVFDGYSPHPTIKDHEHLRRSCKCKCAPDVVFDVNKVAFKDQAGFLTNPVNKQHFVAALMSCLQNVGYSVLQAADDADTLIASTALDMAETQAVIVTANDTDILVLLVHHFKSHLADVYIQFEVMKNRISDITTVSVRDVCDKVGPTKGRILPAIHAISGCDSTSALFGIGKKTAWNKLSSSDTAVHLLDILSSCTATKDEVTSAGLSLLALLYSGRANVNLNTLRYRTYCNLTATSTHIVLPERLPPTQEAAKFHIYRAHLQIMQWKELTTSGMNPEDWGWRLTERHYAPVTTDAPVAPDDILNIVRCKCHVETRRPCGTMQCSCRKHGLACVMACKNCNGTSCENCAAVMTDNISVDDEVEDNEVLEHTDNLADEEFDNDLEYFIPWISEEVVQGI